MKFAWIAGRHIDATTARANDAKVSTLEFRRSFDVAAAFVGLTVCAPVLAAAMVAVWFSDGGAPLFFQARVGKDGLPFRLVKLRTMVVGTGRCGTNSTAADDPRLTRVGRWLRANKLDELPQLWNILVGDMALVGPRPQIESEVQRYTEAERGLLALRPGMTDFASIVFADESAILRYSDDPDRDYDLLIRPWKSGLGLYYVTVRSVGLDLALIVLTIAVCVWRPLGLRGLSWLLRRLDAPDDLVMVARRDQPLRAVTPPIPLSAPVSWP